LHAEAVLQFEQHGGAGQHRDKSADCQTVHPRLPLALGFGIVGAAQIQPRIDDGLRRFLRLRFPHRGLVFLLRLRGVFFLLLLVDLERGLHALPLSHLRVKRPRQCGKRGNNGDQSFHGDTWQLAFAMFITVASDATI
jgi:hypothetical protein